MKKLYFFLMTLVMTMVCSLQANAIKVTIKVDHPEAVTIKANYAPIKDSVQAENILDVTEYTYLEVAANNGYKLVSVTDSVGNAVGYMYSTWGYTIYPKNDGDVYHVHTITMKDYRDASCFITVDQASAVSVQRSGTNEMVTTLQDGDTVEVFYNSKEELPLIINSGKPLYEVTLDGTKVPGTTLFKVSPTKGQHINIVSQFPDKDCPITFEFTNGDKDFFTSVLVDGDEVGPEYYKGFTMKPGQQLTLAGDLNAYKFNSMTVGSERVTYLYGYYYTYITDTTKIIVDVEKYKTLSATLNVDNANAITVFKDRYNMDNTKLSIADGTNAIQVNENSTSLYFKVNSGYYITKFEANDSSLIETNYDQYNKLYYFTVEDSMTITIETAQITYDDKMVVYLNEEPSKLTYFSLTNADREEYKATLKKGYNTIGFNQTQNPFDWSWYHADLNGNSLGGLVYINGTLTEPQYSGSNNYSKTIQNGDVIKIYIGETDKKTYDVKFEGNTEAAVIKQDLITTIDGAAAVTALPGTRYTFTAVEGKQITVKAGETELTAEEGVYTYDVNDNTTFTISELGTGIDTINGAQANQRKVYTIQGVRVSGTKLPAGIYVIDGKKTVIK